MTRGPALALLGLGVLCGLSVVTGVGDLRLSDLGDDPRAALPLFVSRLPRTAAVVLTGASMAVAGLIMQVIARNRFVEPTTAGTGESAASASCSSPSSPRRRRSWPRWASPA